LGERKREEEGGGDSFDRRQAWNNRGDTSPRRNRGGRGRRGNRGERRGNNPNRSLVGSGGGGGEDDAWRGKSSGTTRLEGPFGGGGRRLSGEQEGSGHGGGGGGIVGGLLDVKTEKMSRPASVAAERSNETPVDGEAEVGAMAAGAPHSPGSEAKPGSSPVREAAVSRPTVSEEPLNMTVAAETSAPVEKEHTEEEKGETADKLLGVGGGISSPEPPLGGRRSAGSSLKEEGNNGEGDLAEDFSDFGDSDEDILNQEDEKGESSRPVSRISGKSSRSAKEEVVAAGETTAVAKKEETEQETDASKVRDRRKDRE
jgi:hypothetical protein